MKRKRQSFKNKLPQPIKLNMESPIDLKLLFQEEETEEKKVLLNEFFMANYGVCSRDMRDSIENGCF